jgi:hypothetical protein
MIFFFNFGPLQVDEHRRFWIVYQEADEDSGDIREDFGQMATEVKIAFPMSDKTSTCLAMSSIGK